MINLLFHILGNAFALYLAGRFIKGAEFMGGVGDLFLAGALLGILNFFVKPILKIVSAPLILLTLGLFIFIINLFIIWLLEFLMGGSLLIEGFQAYFWTIVLITLINFIINHYQAD